MAKFTEIKDAIGEIDEETTRIAELIEDYVSQIEGGLDEDETADVLDDLVELAGRLRDIGADPDNPVPPIEEPVV